MFFEMGDDLRKFGANVKKLRETYLPNISFNKAAQAANLAYSQLEKIEAGEADPQFTTIYRMSLSWGVPICEFYEPFANSDDKGDTKKGKTRK